jgi:hypothetical protein
MSGSASPNPDPHSARLATLEGLRARLAADNRSASPAAFVLDGEGLVRTGFPELDAALGGGFPRGTLATLEGPAGSGRSAIATRLLATATAGGGLAALIESPGADEGALYPPALAAAGVDLRRLLVVPANDAKSVARAADILLRAAAFGVVVIPMIRLSAAAWTRLASLTHRAGALLVALGFEASDELRYFASLRIRLRPESVRWAGSSGLFCALAAAGAEATVLKHKRAVPGRRAHLARTTFEPLLIPVPLQRTAPERIIAV